MKKLEFSILSSIIILSIVLICVKIGVDTLFTASGDEYSQIQAETQKLQTDNIIIKEQILAKSSYFNIASEAASLGFIPSTANSSIVLTNPIEPFAFNQ